MDKGYDGDLLVMLQKASGVSVKEFAEEYANLTERQYHRIRNGEAFLRVDHLFKILSKIEIDYECVESFYRESKPYEYLFEELEQIFEEDVIDYKKVVKQLDKIEEVRKNGKLAHDYEFIYEFLIYELQFLEKQDANAVFSFFNAEQLKAFKGTRSLPIYIFQEFFRFLKYTTLDINIIYCLDVLMSYLEQKRNNITQIICKDIFNFCLDRLMIQTDKRYLTLTYVEMYESIIRDNEVYDDFFRMYFLKSLAQLRQNKFSEAEESIQLLKSLAELYEIEKKEYVPFIEEYNRQKELLSI